MKRPNPSPDGAFLVHDVHHVHGKEKPGSKWLVCAISEGLSKNRTLYPAEVPRAAAPLYEGAKVFWNHSKADAGLRNPGTSPAS